MDLQVKSYGFASEKPLFLKRTPFGLQKDSFWRAKGLVLECKRTPFGVQKESFLKCIVLSPNSNPYPAGWKGVRIRVLGLLQSGDCQARHYDANHRHQLDEDVERRT